MNFIAVSDFICCGQIFLMQVVSRDTVVQCCTRIEKKCVEMFVVRKGPPVLPQSASLRLF